MQWSPGRPYERRNNNYRVPSGIRSGNDGNRVSFPSFLPTFVCLSSCASCVQNRSAINVGRPSKRITVCDCDFIYHVWYFYHLRNSRKRMKCVEEKKNRCLEREGARGRMWSVGRKKISRIIESNLWVHERTGGMNVNYSRPARIVHAFIGQPIGM